MVASCWGLLIAFACLPSLVLQSGLHISLHQADCVGTACRLYTCYDTAFLGCAWGWHYNGIPLRINL